VTTATQPERAGRRWTVRVLAAAVLLAAIASCSNMPYYLQSVRGQLDIWSRQHDIDSVIASPDTPEKLRSQLQTVLEIREFASTELALPDNASYRIYANLERPYVVWNVFAAPEFSIQPHQWCFPIAGCVSYRGYFDKTEAERFAARLAAQGFDVFVGGVPAYSLLGYFPDPVLNTFIHYPVPLLARLIFHELAHQVVYVKDDTVFNESFAVAVEQEGLRRWIERHGTSEDMAVYTTLEARRAQFGHFIEAYRNQLDALYRTNLAPEILRERKAETFAQMRTDYEKLKSSWGGFAGFDRFMEQGPNNALLASIAIYSKRVPAFQALLAQHDGDLKRFYGAVRQLARMDKTERTAALEALAPAPQNGTVTAGGR
jgi:predicted aminopeptidase